MKSVFIKYRQVNKYSLQITKRDSKLFLDLSKDLYSEKELPHVSRPTSDNLINCFVLLAESKVVGRFALYDNSKVKIGVERTILLGSYECVNDIEVSQELLKLAKEKAAELGASKMVGPMEGSSWNNYRFTVSDEPFFFTEMIHKPYYPTQFLESGFEVLKTYSSTLNLKVEVDVDRFLEFEKRIRDKKLVIRNVNLKDFESELTKIAVFSNAAFKSNYLFSEYTSESFVEKYLPVKQFIVEDLFSLVEDEQGELQGFLFCIPNYFDKSNKSFVVKSMAILPKRELAGLGVFLGERIHKKALGLGYSEAIHAYMIDDNMSVGLSNRFHAKPYKKHHLYSCDL